eukprot:3014591-Rhodomonas_salina.1
MEEPAAGDTQTGFDPMDQNPFASQQNEVCDEAGCHCGKWDAGSGKEVANLSVSGKLVLAVSGQQPPYVEEEPGS